MFGRHILGTDAQRVIRRMQWVVARMYLMSVISNS